jgi:electron transport complex protein RnfC
MNKEVENVELKNRTFKGGIHIPPFKEQTELLPLKRAKEPNFVVIPLQQHIGAPCEPLVKIGEKVKAGQVIGSSQEFVSAVVHSSISGTVAGIETKLTPTGNKVKSIIIENDGTNESEGKIVSNASLENMTPKEILDIIRKAGITGMGGAGFPTHVKLSPPPDKKIDTVILNGSECESFLTSDARLMIEKPENVVFGLKAIMKVLGVKRGYIGIEDNKTEAIKSIKKTCEKEENIEVVLLKTKYPQGDEKRLINVITGRKVPSGGLPMDVGVIVNNAGTSNAIAEAILEGKPLYERIITVTGNGVKQPQNLIVKIGTSFKDVINQCGGYNKNPGKIIMGGPMMGIAQVTDDVPVIKGTSGILVLTEEESKPQEVLPCIKCGKCLEVCPVRLQPIYISKYSLKKQYDKADEYHALDCIECGLCSYVCPSKIHLVESIRLAKKVITGKRKKARNDGRN